MRWKIVLLLFVLCSISVSASVRISDYPFFFVHDNLFDAKYVLGDEAPAMDVVTATILSTRLANYPDIKTAVGTTMTDSEVQDIKNINAIVIGNSCVNRAAAQLENNPLDCEAGLQDETGYIKVFTHSNKVQLLITGLSAEDRQYVAEMLGDGDLENINRSTYSVKTHTGSKKSTNISSAWQTGSNQSSSRDYESEVVEESYVEPSPILAAKESEPVVEKTVEVKPYERVEIVESKREVGFFEKVWSSLVRFFRSIF